MAAAIGSRNGMSAVSDASVTNMPLDVTRSMKIGPPPPPLSGLFRVR